MTDIWVCANCRSVNNLRAKQCYQCRTPKERAAVDPATVDATTHGRIREIELPEYRPSRTFALVASGFILALAALQPVSLIVTAGHLQGLVGNPTATLEDVDALIAIALVTAGVAVFALVAWAAWLSRAVSTMPALGLGYPAANGLTAFVENFIPGLNLFRIPAILRDMIRRLEPNEGRGDVLLYAAWLGLFGGIVLPRVEGYLNVLGGETLEDLVRNRILVATVSTIGVVAGAILLVGLIWWIEGRIATRRSRQLAGLTEAPAETTEPTPAVPAPPAPPATASPIPSFSPNRPPAPTGQPGSAATGHFGSTAPAAPSRPDPVLTRPITAATGAASSPADAGGTGQPAGPHLVVRIEGGTITGALGDEPPESTTLDELRTAATILADAGGSATIVHDEGGRVTAGVLADAFRAAGTKTTVEPTP